MRQPPPSRDLERGLAAIVRTWVRREGLASEVDDLDRFALDCAREIAQRRRAGELPRIVLRAPTLRELRSGVVPFGRLIGQVVTGRLEGRVADFGPTSGCLREGPVIEPVTLVVPRRLAMGGW